MPQITLQLPQMYGDHHVVAVRNLLFAMAGVSDVYASSCFRLAEIHFDEALVGEEKIRAALDSAGYLQELPVTVEAGADQRASGEKKVLFRHTASFTQTGVVSFAQDIAAVGRPLWPCPGFRRLDHIEEDPPYGQES